MYSIGRRYVTLFCIFLSVCVLLPGPRVCRSPGRTGRTHPRRQPRICCQVRAEYVQFTCVVVCCCGVSLCVYADETRMRQFVCWMGRTESRGNGRGHRNGRVIRVIYSRMPDLTIFCEQQNTTLQCCRSYAGAQLSRGEVARIGCPGHAFDRPLKSRTHANTNHTKISVLSGSCTFCVFNF